LLLDQQYQDFGNDIKYLSENLKDISRVVENAKSQQSQQSAGLRSPSLQKDWDLSSLKEIIGDYEKTLSDCRKLLEENHEFRKKRNFAYNNYWNLVIQPKIDQLRKRLQLHNTKIVILLKPLEIRLLTDIHQDIVERIDAVHRSVLQLQGLLIPDIDQAISEQGRDIPVSLDIPADIAKKFQTSTEKSRPEIRTPGRFPLQAGADAFVLYLEESTKKFTSTGNFINNRTPLAQQYLNLLKCIWIIKQLRESDALRDAPRDSQWPGYISQLNQDLSVECQRFTAPQAHRLIPPDLSSLAHADQYNIWSGENIAEYISPHSDLHKTEVLRIPMPSPPQSPNLQRVMIIYQLGPTEYRLVETVGDKNAPTTRADLHMDIDLRTIHLTPIYAIPSSRPKPLEVLIRSASTEITPAFQELKHLLRLQRLLTGYDVYDRYDQAMVKVSFFVSNKSAKEEHGRLQLWMPRPLCSPSTSSTSTSPISSGAQSPTHRSRPSLTGSIDSIALEKIDERIPQSHRSSSINSSATKLTKLTKLTKHRPPSISTRSISSSMSRSSVTSTTTIRTGTGTARLHLKPAKPLLVIFLKGQDASANLALAAIQIDDDTEVKRERCGCRRKDSQCLDSCIERADGFLRIQRWDATQGLSGWNLASLGVDQKRELPHDVYKDVKRVTIKFESVAGWSLILEIVPTLYRQRLTSITRPSQIQWESM
jgi:hypothetical protein